MAKFKPFDLGQVLRTQAALEQFGQQQQMNQYRIDEGQRKTQYRDALSQALGNPGAMEQVSKQFPLLSQSFKTQQQAQKAQDLNFQINGYKLMSHGAKTVFDEKSYQKFKKQLEDTGVSDPGELPETYDNNTKKMLSGLTNKSNEALKKLTIRSGEQSTDYVTQGGKIVSQGKPYEPNKKSKEHPIVRLQKQRDSLPEGSKKREEIDKLINKKISNKVSPEKSLKRLAQEEYNRVYNAERRSFNDHNEARKIALGAKKSVLDGKKTLSKKDILKSYKEELSKNPDNKKQLDKKYLELLKGAK